MVADNKKKICEFILFIPLSFLDLKICLSFLFWFAGQKKKIRVIFLNSQSITIYIIYKATRAANQTKQQQQQQNPRHNALSMATLTFIYTQTKHKIKLKICLG